MYIQWHIRELELKLETLKAEDGMATGQYFYTLCVSLTIACR